MTAIRTSAGKVLVPLGQAPLGASYASLLNELLKNGVRPPFARDRRVKGAWPDPRKPGQEWEVKEFAAAIGRTARQVQRYCNAGKLPPHEVHLAIEAALFGPDLTDYAEWRKALGDAYELQNQKQALVTAAHPESGIAAPPREPKSSLPLPVHRGRVPLHFHGRHRELETIDALLTGAPHRVALHGPHGVGKTALAAGYAFYSRQKYRAVAWIDAETEEGCTAGLVAFGQQMSWCSPSATSKAALAATLLRLAEDDSGCLVVYDNAPSPAELHNYLPNGSPHILITSNKPTWRSEAVPTEVRGWSPEVGAVYLSKRLGINDDDRDASALSNELGGFPLALELAAAFCEHRQLTVAAYRQRLLEAPGRYLLKTGLFIPGYPRSIYDAFALAMNAVEEENPAAISVLKLLCALAPEPIPQFVISAGYKLLQSDVVETLENDACDSALAVLRDYALITTCTIDAGHGEPELGSFEVHRLVKLVVQERFGFDESAKNCMALALANSFSTIPEADAYSINLMFKLRRHVTYLLGEASASPTNAVITRLHGKYANYWIYINKYKNTPEIALHHARRYLQRLKLAHGGHSQEASAGFVTIGLACYHSEKFRSAELFLERAIGIRAQCYPSWHPDVVEARLALAKIVWRRGDQERAKEIWDDIVFYRNVTWPKDHPELARVLIHWAFTNSFKDRREEAMLMMAEALVIQIFTLPVDHRDIVDTRNHLGQFLRFPPCKDVDALLTIEAHARAMMERRSYKKVDEGRLWLELALLCHEHELLVVSRAYFDKALQSLPDPSSERLQALIKGWRFEPIGGDQSLVGCYRAALEQAIRLNDPIEISRTAAGLAFVLHAYGDETEADAVRRRFLPHQHLFGNASLANGNTAKRNLFST